MRTSALAAPLGRVKRHDLGGGFASYVISPDGAAQFSSLCWQSGGPNADLLWQSRAGLGGSPDVREGWRTISQIRAQFPH
jgi:hypothetical protein